jgi:hypothetical protein
MDSSNKKNVCAQSHNTLILIYENYIYFDNTVNIRSSAVLSYHRAHSAVQSSINIALAFMHFMDYYRTTEYL